MPRIKSSWLNRAPNAMGSTISSFKALSRVERMRLLSFLLVIAILPFSLLSSYKSSEPLPKLARPPLLCTKNKPWVQMGDALLRQPTTSDELRNLSRTPIHFLTYGDERFQKSLARIAEEARSFKMFSSISQYGPRNLSLVVRGHFEDILSRGRGGGFWIWKILVFRDALERADWGDYVLYADAGCTLNKEGINRLQQYMLMLKRSRTGVLSIAEEHLERKYTSGRVLETFGVRENEHFLNSPHYWAGMLLMQKRRKVLRMMDAVIRLLYADRWMFTDVYRNYRAVKGFKENKHDQSVLSIIRKCWGTVVVGDLVMNRDQNHPVWATRIRE